MKSNDRQVGGTHYKGTEIQPWDYIHSQSMGFLEGNIIKYVSRWNRVRDVEDLQKAKHYIEKLLELNNGDNGREG